MPFKRAEVRLRSVEEQADGERSGDPGRGINIGTLQGLSLSNRHQVRLWVHWGISPIVQPTD
jgi:hypothetical protein